MSDREAPTYTLHVVSHTHWDREWYRPFQAFRLRLVQLVEELLDILEAQPDFRHFMLDGQTIILQDILDLRPDLEARLRAQVTAGRIIIGPWFVLPDEFLVSPEALVRNLSLGDRMGRQWGAGMDVGYIPDPFGHIRQLPQLLRGFGIDSAVFARGAGDAPVEFRWAAPDGAQILVCYLRDHYGNAAELPGDPEGVAGALAAARDSLAPHTAVSHLLMMQGTDHVHARADLPALLTAADARLPDRVLHSSLVDYVAAVRAELHGAGLARLPVRGGEMRDPSRRHLLPGVLSTRMWIKQRNHACQTLLERWAEPFGALSGLVGERRPTLAPAIQRAWKYLLENHAHDSICGCSIDQVHHEMATRFDWCQQLGEEITRAALDRLAGRVDTGSDGLPRLVVFNPSPVERTDRVLARVTPPVDPAGLVLLGPDHRPVAFDVVRRTCQSELQMTFDAPTMGHLAAQAEAEHGVIWGEWRIQALHAWVEGKTAHVAAAVTRAGATPSAQPPTAGLERLKALLRDPTLEAFSVRVREDDALEIAFIAREVPALGYATYRFAAREETERGHRAAVHATRQSEPADTAPTVENEFLQVTVDPRTGLLTIVDRRTGLRLGGCHRLVDGGDRGDEYNYCPPERDQLIASPIAPPRVRWEEDAAGQHLTIEATYRLPEGLSADRRSRSTSMVDVPVSTRVTLMKGVQRVDFNTTVENRAHDHRLRVHFPTPFDVDSATAAGHWDAITWNLSLPQDTEDWIEQPVPTRPQRGWTSVSDGDHGVTLANRGLPEVEVIPDGCEIALTLLRCVGWLSRDDLACREGQAGPALPTPEAQCPGRHTFRYALFVHPGDWRAAVRQAEAFQSDLRAVSAPARSGALPGSQSFVQVAPEALAVSAIKPPEEGEGLIVRLWNVAAEPVTGTVRLWRPFLRAVRTDLAERTQEELARRSDEVSIPVGGREVITLRFTF
jgi:alpha-mannosidase